MVMEKVEVAKRIEEAVGNRQGQRTDLQNESTTKELVPKLAQVEPGTKTREIAARSVDMNRETYRQAKAVGTNPHYITDADVRIFILSSL